MPLPDERQRLLEAARTLKMARSAHAYVRGNTIKFYEWLAASPMASRAPQGPPVWICGDCHLGNLGPLADGRGGLEIQIRDLDQTVIGSPALDIIRLALSLASATRGSDLPGVVTAQMMEAIVEGYEAALADPEAEIIEAGPEPDVVRTVRKRALGRRWRHLARERFNDTDPEIPLGRKFWELSADERQDLAATLADPLLAKTVLSLPDENFTTRMVDAAYWMKGCSSLGLLRYAAIIAVRRNGKRERFALLDVKEATAPAAPSAPNGSMPPDHAQRVVAGARALSPHLGERMIATKALGRSVFVRELMPQDLKLEVQQFTRSEAVRAARYLAWVVGHAHARQLDSASRHAWRQTLLDYRSADLDAPLWLWRSVVELSGAHEAGYLEHCRSYAMSEAVRPEQPSRTEIRREPNKENVA
jgi:uncharacterized protein (DUF2252 family)